MAPWIKHSISSPVTSLILRISARLSSLAGTTRQAPWFLQKSCPILPCNGHLSASMEFHPGKMFSEICKHSHVLDNHPIQSGPVIGQYIFIQSGKFRFFYQCVYRQIYFSLKKMSIPDAGNQFFFRKIFRISSGPETAATQIYSIRTGMDSPVKGFRISGRCSNSTFLLLS